MITDSIDNKELRWIAVYGPSQAIRLLAVAEIDRRGKAEEPTEKAEAVKYWRGYGCFKGMFVVTKNNVVASVNLDRYQLWIGQSWDDRASDWCEVSRAEYEAAKQPKPAGKVKVVPYKPYGIKAAPECDDCRTYATDYCVYDRDECDNGKCWNHSPPNKPTERPEIEPEPWLCLPNEILVRNEVDAMFQQLQRRVEAVERRGK